MERRAFLVGSLAAVGGVACAREPVITVQYAQVTGINPMGVGLNVKLKVKNPNRVDVQVRRVAVITVIANQFTLPPLEYQPNVWLPAGQEIYMDAPVVIPWAMILPLLSATVSSTELSYLAKGEADITATRNLGLQYNKYPIEEKGVIQRSALLAMAQRSFPGAR